MSTTKICRTCETEKGVSEFRFYNKSQGIYTLYCKACLRDKAKNKWHGDETFRKQTMSQRQGRLDRNREFFLTYMSDKECMQCGENDIRCLDFDHVDQKTKSNLVSYMAKTTYSLEAIKAEMDKCRVLCANCHRKHTYHQLGGWFRG